MWLFFRQRQSKAMTICRPFKDSSPKAAEEDTSNKTKPAILFVPNPCNTKQSVDSKQDDSDKYKKVKTSSCDTNSSKLDVLIGNRDFKQITTDNLSQESLDSQHSLMFGCPLDGDDDDLESAFIHNLHPTLGNEPIGSTPENLNVETIDKEFGLGDCNDIDVFDNQVFDMNDSVGSLGEEQGYLTPAYYDPDTGTVTLLLPTLNPEY